MKNIISTALFIVGLSIGMVIVGCSNERSPEVLRENQEKLSGEGLLIGELRDGREIRQYKISRGDTTAHYIYVMSGSRSDSNEISVIQPSSKTEQTVSIVEDGSHVHVMLPRQIDNKSIIIIDGKAYKLIPIEK